MQKNYQKKGTTVPSLGSKATIPMQRYTTRDSDHSCILMYQSYGTRERLLPKKIKKGHTVHQRYERTNSYY